MQNGTIPKEFLRVAKRVCARAKKEGLPLLDRMRVLCGRAWASDGAVVLRINGTGNSATGYIDPKPLAAAKAIEFFPKGDGLNVKQAESFTHHSHAEGDFPNYEQDFPQFDDPQGDGYHFPFFVDPVILLDAIDIFDKKGDRPNVQIFLPKDNDGKTPLVILGEVDGREGRALLLPLSAARPVKT